MPRLFIAVSLPPTVRAQLAQAQPGRDRGVRLVEPLQMHLTLHFLGDAPTNQVLSTLGSVEPKSLELAIAGVGRFGSRAGEQILWAGLSPCSALFELHLSLADALRRDGCAVETKAYVPHITLARCRRGVPQEFVDEFLQRQAELSLPPFSVNSFELYSSRLTAGNHVYHCEHSFAVATRTNDGAV